MRRLCALFALAFMLVGRADAGIAEDGDPRVVAKLSNELRRHYADWLGARAVYERQQETYWSAVSARRSERRRKMGAGAAVTAADFVMQQPPKYTGPTLRPEIAKIMAEVDPPSPTGDITTLPEMLASARQHYRFSPTLIPELEFKRRYAAEALAVGLSKEQVVRVYALETGGRGTFDMQAGINPDTKTGRAISTAMGYAQLLAANSIDELVRYGDGFIARLSTMAARPGTSSERARELAAKADVLRQMLRVGRSVPREWSRHVELARTAPGYGIHALNLDGDIGPWLQVIKLKGIKDLAEQNGRDRLTPAELELMNLAGPRTGLEMMDGAGAAAPTANFFSRAAYYRNTIVREKTGAELLAAIDGRMNENMLRPGSIEFAGVFDELTGVSRPAAFEDRRNLLRAPLPGPMSAAGARPSLPSVPVAAVPRPVEAQRVEAQRVEARASQAGPQYPVPPEPVQAVRPKTADPGLRLQWAPPRFNERPGLPAGFPD